MIKFQHFLLATTSLLSLNLNLNSVVAQSQYNLDDMAKLYAKELCIVAKTGTNPTTDKGINMMVANLAEKYGYDFMMRFVETDEDFDKLATKHAINICARDLLEVLK